MSKRSADDILGYNVNFEDDCDDNCDKENRNKNENGSNESNTKDQKNQQKNDKNPLFQILNSNRVYDRDDVLKILVKKEGLEYLIKDLKKASEDNTRDVRYVQTLIKDIVFASALPEALEDIMGHKYDEEQNISRDDLGYLMNEILVFLNKSYDGGFVSMYSEEASNAIRDSYRDILYRYNKKKVKKLTEKIKDLSKTNAKQICIITAGSKPSSIYSLLKFLYRTVDDGSDVFKMNTSNLLKLFKVCYGKNKLNEVIKALMLEKSFDISNLSDERKSLSAELDMLIREYLESLDKSDILNILKGYISSRKKQEKFNKIPRRFGDSKTIHPDDFPKLIKTIEELERKDFSAIQFLRK